MPPRGTLGVMQTIRSKKLGAELRLLRETAGLKSEEACARLAWSPSKLDRIERGVNIPKLGDLKNALNLYNADAGQRGELEALRDEARTGRRGWWDGYSDVFTGILPRLEDSATAIRGFEMNLIPGL